MHRWVLLGYLHNYQHIVWRVRRRNVGIDVNAGATGDFFGAALSWLLLLPFTLVLTHHSLPGLFDKSVNAQMFSKTFQIFQKCFGDDATGAATADTGHIGRGSTEAGRHRSVEALSAEPANLC
ncbi:hypothetical protein K438DRAFT_1991911 [Mycena galopus ATCC 62051]|nr:hypothetical protein K438DRAFT_1991911 [Mycena galopus ATCC 62051]